MDKLTIARECFFLPEGSSVPHWLVRPFEHFNSDRYRRAFNTGHAGKPAGTTARKDKRRKICVSIGGKMIRMYAYQVVWALTHGEWPDMQIDHKDVDPTNDAPSNLRKATQVQNIGNIALPKHNTSGLKGVSWRKDRGYWRAYIKVNGKYVHLGHYGTREAASEAYMAAARKHFGEEFARAA